MLSLMHKLLWQTSIVQLIQTAKLALQGYLVTSRMICSITFKHNQKSDIILQYNAFSFVLFLSGLVVILMSFEIEHNVLDSSLLEGMQTSAPIPCYSEQLTSDW